jgi:hypothetical protein
MELSDNRQIGGIKNKTLFGKIWDMTKVPVRLVVSYFNWIWVHSRHKNTAVQRALLYSRTMDLEGSGYLCHT